MANEIEGEGIIYSHKNIIDDDIQHHGFLAGLHGQAASEESNPNYGVLIVGWRDGNQVRMNQLNKNKKND